MNHPALSATIVASILLLAPPMVSTASDGDPLAVRKWPGGVVSLETHWGLQLLIDPTGSAGQALTRSSDQTVSPAEDLDHTLSRRPNQAEASWLSSVDTGQSEQQDPNAIQVKTVRQLGDQRSLLIEADGVRIVYIPSAWFTALADRDSITFDPQRIGRVDLLILATPNPAHLRASCTVALVNSVNPRLVMLNRIGTDQRGEIEPLRDQIEHENALRRIDHNTLALSNANTDRPLQVVLMGDASWDMPRELAELFVAMETANQQSQRVFAKLSKNQLNFRPANGTHTPRWNTEHMMGRQLLFFSQIYHQQDAMIPVIDLNPKQMPPDYVFAHPDWDGHEEARQTQRVSEFTRRFAYLLADLDLDAQAPGSRWTLRRLLNQMQRHYGEHTANTVKKFQLPGWPID